MITFDAFLVFLATAALPVIYVFLLSRWLEPEYEQVHPSTKAPATPRPKRDRIAQPA